MTGPSALSQTSEYALRIMAFLAQQPAVTFVPAIAMEGKVKVPANYRAKILNQLGRAGLLQSTRGRTGGFRLSRPANEIHLADVVTPFEPAGAARSCILGRASCEDALPCAAHHGWRELGKARDQYLRDTTIADLAS